MNDDSRKQHQILRHTANRAHPYSRFATGTLETLLKVPRERGDEPHVLVRNFYDAHYSANIMKLVVYGKQPAEVLSGLVVENFGGVKNIGISAPTYSGTQPLKPL